MKKVIGFVGSPRKDGNTQVLVKEVLAGAAEQGADTKLIDLAASKIHGCIACMHCQSNDGCAQTDDMTTFYEEMKNADAIVLGSPVYMGQMTAQTKLFVDRLFAFLNATDYTSKLGEGKPTILAFTQQQSDPKTFKGYFDQTANALGLLGLKIQDTIVSGGNMGPKGQVKQQTDVMERARQIGSTLVKK